MIELETKEKLIEALEQDVVMLRRELAEARALLQEAMAALDTTLVLAAIDAHMEAQ